MLLFNPETKKRIDSLVADLPQGVLLVGAVGSGLLTTAKHIAGRNLAAIIEPTDKDGNVNHARGGVSVKRIRELYEQSHSKSVTTQVFIIDDADKMSAGAQNALLKLLEEPSQQVRFILTTHQPEAILATINSRVERVTVLPISREQSEQLLLGHKLQPTQAAQALFVAAGKPAELQRMAGDSAYFDAKVGIMGAAKTFLSGSKTDRLEIAFKYAADREKSLQLLQSCITIIKFSLNGAPNESTITQANRLADAYDAIAANGNAKLHLVATVI